MRLRRADAGLALGVLVTTMGLSGLLTASAGAHAHVSPSVVETGTAETYTVVVPTEASANTTSVEVSVPDGVQVDAFEAAPGWKRRVEASDAGAEGDVSKITWTGGDVPEGEAAYLRFQGEVNASGAYAFKVRQTYSDGEVADWAGPESSEFPAPIVRVEDSLGGGGSSSAIAVAALIAATIALLVGLAGLAARGGRPLT